MIQAEFESLLKRTMGLDAASIGSSAIERAVQLRASACERGDPRTYWELLRTSATELQALIETVVVPETWFFRDREAFAALAHIACHEWLPTHPHGLLRLLSLPCSSGEEPYSMAMALLDAGFPTNRYCIDAIDISARVLTHAKRAVYRKNSFRGVELGFRDRYFEVTAQGHRVGDAAREQVRFRRGNLLAVDFLPGTEIYDVIFCRNLLIYFDRSTQDRAVHVLQRLLAVNGVLFVGPSETGLLLSHRFVSAKMPLAFAFRKIGASSRATAPASTRPLLRALTRPKIAASPAALESSSLNRAKALAALLARTPADPAKAEPELGIDHAAQLADQGRLAEAAQCCEAFMCGHAPSAQAFCLMGLIRAAGGELPAAAQYYRKALYLDQNHQETLVHLAFLLDKQGDAAGAQVLRNRMLRIAQKSAK